jgi:hypothetical protein
LLLITIFLRSTPVVIGLVENSDGIPFPIVDGHPLVTEKLAHTDLYLKHSRFARSLSLTTTFTPMTITALDLGLRENSFWLSYNRINICCSSEELANPSTIITKTIVIPITDKLADQDGSLDLMFFATNPTSQTTEDEGVNDHTKWLLNGLSVVSHPAVPDLASMRDYLRSTLTRERAL